MPKKAQTRKYEFDLLILPPLKMVLGDIPVPDPRRPHSGARRSTSALLNRQEIVQRLIKYFNSK